MERRRASSSGSRGALGLLVSSVTLRVRQASEDPEGSSSTSSGAFTRNCATVATWSRLCHNPSSCSAPQCTDVDSRGGRSRAPVRDRPPGHHGGRDVAVSSAWDVRGASFGFTIPKAAIAGRAKTAHDRELRDVDLHDVTITSSPPSGHHGRERALARCEAAARPGAPVHGDARMSIVAKFAPFSRVSSALPLKRPYSPEALAARSAHRAGCHPERRPDRRGSCGVQLIAE